MCCDGVIVHVLKFDDDDGGVADFALGLEPVKVEEPAISSIQDWDPRWQLFTNEVEYSSNEDGKQDGCDNASLFNPFPW